MGARNFVYQNRCVVITDDDYEFGNLPTLGDYIDISRSYPSRIVEIDDLELTKVKEYRATIKPIHLHNIVVTSGYYEHACLDFLRNEDNSSIDYVGWSCHYDFNTIEEIIEPITSNFNITAEEIKTLIKHRMDAMHITAETDEDKFQSFYEYLMDDIDEKIIENEKIICNKIIDLIKESYGYEEYGCVAVASNGEGFYQKVE